MWNNLPLVQREEYKKMILIFASFTELFAQKADSDENSSFVLSSPIINSKFQETVFQRSFNATAEDIGNTSYDASIYMTDADGKSHKYLVGIKTFGIGSGDQKIAQFKAMHDEWSNIINTIRENSKDSDGNNKSKEEIDRINHSLYLNLATKIATLRNLRIASSEAKLHGFDIDKDKDIVESVYHVLMPSKKGEMPQIFVGETAYNKIDLGNLEILGCTSSKNPTNFTFSDRKHQYKFTSADSQLLMNFNNSNIIQETWDVKYADDAYKMFENLANEVFAKDKEFITESYSWLLTNKDGEMEMSSGLNSFYGTSSKKSKDDRKKSVVTLKKKFEGIIDDAKLNQIANMITSFLLPEDEMHWFDKIELRNSIMDEIRNLKQDELSDMVLHMIYRPKNEIYIPIPDSRNFHLAHPDFFGKGIGSFQEDSPSKLLNDKEGCKFHLIFEPSKTEMDAFITQDNGKAIQSWSKQSIMGEWMLREVFQLDDYEPLTAQRLNELGINGIRLYKTNKTDDVHFEFIWIDSKNPPSDYIAKK